MSLPRPENPIPHIPISDLPPEEQDKALLEAVARKVVQMGLSVPAVFFLESTKPLSFIGSQALVFLEPFVKSIFNLASYDRFVALMEDRSNIEKLIQRIEDLDDQAQKAEKERRKKEKEEKKEERMRRAAAGLPPAQGSLRERLSRWFGRS